MTTKKDVARQFGRMSQAYAASPGHAAGLDLEIVTEFLDPSPRLAVLDIATGAGHTAARIAPLVRHVLATDLSREMLGQTMQLAASRGLTNVGGALMDAEDLALADRSCDAVTCRIAPHHFHDPRRALREIARVLKSGGVFVLEDSLAPADPVLDQFLNDVEVMRDPTHVRSYTFVEWRETIEAAGLLVRKVRIHRKRHAVAEWLARAGLAPGDLAAVQARLDHAPPEAREYFEMAFDGGRAIALTDDKLIVRAEKP